MRELQEFEFSKRGRGKYDWEKLCNGGIYEMVHGVDYQVSADSLRNSLYSQARKLGLRVRIQVKPPEGKSPETTVVQFYDRVIPSPEENVAAAAPTGAKKAAKPKK